MGLYGSPDVGNLYTPKREPKKIKKEGYEPQKHTWVWVTIVIINLLILLMVGVTIADIITLVILDSIILFGISIVSLIVNLIGKRKVKQDVKFIVISIFIFLISTVILGTCF